MGTIISLVSGKGGTGKTTAVAAIATSLAALGKRTLCIDFCIGQSDLDLSLCLETPTYNFVDVISGVAKLKDAIVSSSNIPGLYFLSSPDSYDFGIDEESFDSFLKMVREKFDFCIIDTSSGINAEVFMLSEKSDMSIIVTTGEIPAIRRAAKLASLLSTSGAKEIRVLVNRVVLKNLKFIKTSIDDIIDKVGVRLIGIVPEDNAVFRSLHKNALLIMYRPMLSIYDFMDIARRINGEDTPLSTKSFSKRHFPDFIKKEHDYFIEDIEVPQLQQPILFSDEPEEYDPVETANNQPAEPAETLDDSNAQDASNPHQLITQVTSIIDEINALGSLFD